jgi:hypothetical protein
LIGAGALHFVQGDTAFWESAGGRIWASFFPNKAVKGMDVVVAEAAVEGEGQMVFFSDGQREFAEAAGSEVGVATAEEMLADAVATVFGKSADLGDVAYVVAHPGAEQECNAGAGGTVDGYERRDGVEDSAAREAHDVVEEAQRAGDGAVLVVDITVDVAPVGRGDDAGSRLIIGFGPAMNFNVWRKRAGWLGAGSLDGPGEEESAIAAETLVYERGDEVIGGMDEELGLDPMQSGGLLESADGVAKQLQLDGVATVTSGIGILDEQIADDALGALINEKTVAVDASALDGGEAGEDSGVGVTQNHVGRGSVIPMESASPDRNFLLHQGTKVG